MKITSLLENTSQHGLAVEHRLSLYIETVFAGMHLTKHGLQAAERVSYIRQLADQLLASSFTLDTFT